MKRLPTSAIALLLFAKVSVGCPQAVKDITAGAGVGLCILNHLDEPPEQIVKDCEGATIAMIDQYKTAERALEERHASRVRLLGDAGAPEGGR